MAKDSAEITAERSGGSDELHDLRAAVLDLGKMLRSFGKSRLAEVDGDVAEEARDLAVEGRRILQKVEERIGQLEKRAENGLREHPGAWATGLLGAIGFGLVLSLVLRGHED